MLELNRIYCMDCLEGMRQIDSESIDLILTDPPYNENYNYRGSSFIDHRDDYYQFLEECFVEFNRILKPTGSFYLKHSSRQIATILPMISKHFNFKNLIIWISNSQAHPEANYDSYYEPIYFSTKTDNYIFNKRAELRKKPPNYWSGEGKEFIGLLTNCFYDIKKIQAGCLGKVEGGTTEKQKLHPCSMPLRLADRLIKVSTNEGNIVLDPFMGSGTTAISARKLNRNYLGFEIDPNYHEIDINRIDEEEKQSLLPAFKDGVSETAVMLKSHATATPSRATGHEGVLGNTK